MHKNQRGRPGREVVMANAFRDDLSLRAENDKKILLRLLDLMETIIRDPFKGIGKPEPLKHKFGGAWSRRLTQEHRVIYSVRDDRIEFLQGRYHY